MASGVRPASVWRSEDPAWVEEDAVEWDGEENEPESDQDVDVRVPEGEDDDGWRPQGSLRRMASMYVQLFFFLRGATYVDLNAQ